MGIRYRKSVNIGPFRVNASKSGLGWSVGGPGGRYTKMANGRTRVTASVPGTGISWVKETKKTLKAAKEPVVKKPIWEKTEEELTGWECFALFLFDVVKWTCIALLIGLGVFCLLGLPFFLEVIKKVK